jgi:LysR family transcriptional activator of nhaA
MDWLNYHHLLYFCTAARAGGLTAAARELHLSPSTLSGQIKELEQMLGEPLFRRVGRRIEPTEMGRIVLRYGEEIFSLGRELLDTVRGRPTGRPVRCTVGIVDTLPKTLVRRLLQPALALPEPLRLICREDAHDRLLARLALHELDLVLSDGGVPAGSKIRAFAHPLGECGVSFFATAELRRRTSAPFPQCLGELPLLLPAEGLPLRRALDAWFDRMELRPQIRGEFEDSALLKAFGAVGEGVFPAPSAVEAEVAAHYRVELVGRLDEVRERFFAISAARRLDHPAVRVLLDAARQVFTAAPPPTRPARATPRRKR